ncbi:MAG: F420-nonreducing hydrogenase [Candidatus Fischerbacteria bacterium RBG_13_37_8]|uniref:F420-nonreducing hydrogenase n=1 Tax=Candidatus Fischerbacteria bacterium RBG_13_37_8 TaxID=1817863 RepID=A0A1F5VQ67_9BACT|nr:MAG: F420-nonreducing hydrogenase [Candidatus Fischerbacteria bacterium RBG_13_37_8]
MAKRITIDPITRLEGHGKIEIFLDDKGNVENAYLQVPELRGFEQFCIGRPAEELARITPRICGVCPTAHHMASTKALDDLFKVDPPPAAKKIRELFYNIFMLEDHTLHFYFLGGPDFVVGPTAPAAERNILGVLAKVGLEIGGKVIKMRRECRELMTMMAGKVIHPVFGLPGGVSKGVKKEDAEKIQTVAKAGVEFAQFSLKVFEDIVLKNKDYLKLIVGDIYMNKTYSMGMVDNNNHVNYYDGLVRVVDTNGKEFVKFKPRDYAKVVAEHVEPWSYIKFLYLKEVGWKGFVDGQESGVYRVAPMARLNAADGMSTPLAQAEYEKLFKTLGGKPVQLTLATHWARLIEALNAAEVMLKLSQDPEITSDKFRTIPTATPEEGIGIVEAPRGTLFHHYKTDKNGMITDCNLIVATQNNSAVMNMGIQKAAKALIKDGNVNEGILNLIELTYRAYDPCHACGTHSLPGNYPIEVNIYDATKTLVKTIKK